MSGNIRFRLDLSGEDFSPTGSISLNRVLQRITLLLNDHQTYTMYHGTTRASAQRILKAGFRQSKDGMLGPGVYLSTDLEKASRYPINCPEEDKVVIEVQVNVGKVIVINYQNHPLQKTWHDHGFDTAWVPPNCGMVKSGLEENCVWEPSRIRVIQLIEPTKVPVLSEDPADDRTYIMYHGTTQEYAQKIHQKGFERSKAGMLGPGVYLSRDLQKASRYPINCPEEDRVVIKVKVNVGKVKAINCQNHPMQKTWHQNGYDTAWVPPNCGMVKSGLEENCVWEPSRIKIIQLIEPTKVPAQPDYM
ncbi:uncharacterized protein LOC118559161 [Fundulus heteroclitus]|uniref:uncharacterized protein LOC118559161 n=1 Tax=Fundulus heteroclitus TaxID=8078 RepID=UPI00165CD08E|nr:uncharacterized protein LOC118559161 [Fundulus heteroclitus]